MQIAHFPPVRPLQDADGMDRVLVHVHRREGRGPAVGEAQLHRPAAEQAVTDDLPVVVGRHFPAVHREDGVPPLEAGLRRRRMGIRIGQHRADALPGAVGIIQLEIHPESPGMPGNTADERSKVVRQHRPAVDVLPEGVLVADVRHLPDGLLPVLPALQRRSDLVPPQVVLVHDVPGESIDILPLQLGLVVQPAVLVRHLLPAAASQHRQDQETEDPSGTFHTAKITKKTLPLAREVLFVYALWITRRQEPRPRRREQPPRQPSWNGCGGCSSSPPWGRRGRPR